MADGMFTKIFKRMTGNSRESNFGNPIVPFTAPDTGTEVPASMRVLKDTGDLPVPWLTSSSFFNPNLDTGTDGAGQWRELYDALKDPKVIACYDLRAGITASLPWTIVGQDETPQDVTDTVDDIIQAMNCVDMFQQMAVAFYYGMVGIELFWRKEGKYLIPFRQESVDPLYMIYDMNRRLFVNGVAPAPGKMMVHRHGGLFRNPYGLGRGRTVPRWVRVKVSIAYAIYKNFPRFANDRLLFEYLQSGNEAENQKLIQIAQSMLDNPGIAIPKNSMSVTPIKLESKFEVGEKLIQAADAQIAMAILGNTLTTGEGRGAGLGSQGQSKQHGDTQDKTVWFDAQSLEATLNETLIPWIVQVNWGPNVKPPLIKFDAEVKPDVVSQLEALTSLADGGMKIPLSWLRAKFGIPEPDDDDALFTPPKPVPPPLAPPKVEPPPIKTLSAKEVHDDDLAAHGHLDDWGIQFADRFAGFHRSIGRVLREQVKK